MLPSIGYIQALPESGGGFVPCTNQQEHRHAQELISKGTHELLRPMITCHAMVCEYDRDIQGTQKA